MPPVAMIVKGAAVAAVAAVSLQVSAGAQPSASRIVDRTFVCSTRSNGGVYEIEAKAYSGVREGSARWARLPFAVISTGSAGSAATVLDNSLAWITAGRPSSTTLLGDYPFPVRAALYGTLAVNRSTCRASARQVPLGSGGLEGGTAGRLGDAFDCTSPRTVLVRVRAVLTSPGTLKGHDIFLLTTSPVREAAVAVRTESGKPLVYAQVLQSGKTRLFTAKGCLPD